MSNILLITAPRSSTVKKFLLKKQKIKQLKSLVHAPVLLKAVSDTLVDNFFSTHPNFDAYGNLRRWRKWLWSNEKMLVPYRQSNAGLDCPTTSSITTRPIYRPVNGVKNIATILDKGQNIKENTKTYSSY